MEDLKVSEFDFIHMCRLCLSGVSKDDIFLFSSGLGKTIADIIMECVPVQIIRQDKMPTYICKLCFTQLKKFHQFQIQALQSDETLKRYLRQLSDSNPQIKVEMALEELSNNIINQNYNADVTAKSEPVETSDEFDIFYPKQKMLTSFKNKISPKISLESETKDEPKVDNSFIATECANTFESLSNNEDSEIGCEDSMIEFVDTKAGVDMPRNFDCSLDFENDTTEKIFEKSEETYIPSKEADSSLRPEKIKDAECLRSNENDQSKTEHSSKLKKTYRCNICNRCFRQSHSLKRHNSIHTGEKPYQCDICKKCFSELSNLKKHSFIHTGEKPYQCDICKMCFRQVGTLKNHNLKHTGEKPFQCDICKIYFRHITSLQTHKSKHSGEKPYQCDVCKTCFRHAHSLKRHNLVHTGEKPHQCDICKRRFRQVNHLKNHKLKHTGEKPYHCEICKKCFRQLHSLTKHNLIHTGDTQ